MSFFARKLETSTRFKMAEDSKQVKKAKTDKESAKPTVPRTALELQRLQYERLMKDPVSYQCIIC
jgi:hypothetical protein